MSKPKTKEQLLNEALETQKRNQEAYYRNLMTLMATGTHEEVVKIKKKQTEEIAKEPLVEPRQRGMWNATTVKNGLFMGRFSRDNERR